MTEDLAGSRPLYAISVAAELSGVSVPTLRLFERHGLVRPARTQGGTRRYSQADIRDIKKANELVEAGVPLAAVARILALSARNEDLSASNTALKAANAQLRRAAATRPPD